MIFDVHTHVNVGGKENYTKTMGGFDIDDLAKAMNQYKIDKAITMVNPYIQEYQCYDCDKHRVFVRDSSPGEQVIDCSLCHTRIYQGPDPLRKYNVKLLEDAHPYRGKIYPFIYLGLSNSTINEEIKFFEQNYRGLYFGYKLHPKISRRSLDEIPEFHSNLPVIVHSGETQYDDPDTIVRFAQRYKGSVLIAHACRLKIAALQAVARTPNLFVDVCPSHLMYEGRENDLFAPLNTKIQNPTDIYKEVIKYAGINKTLFGTDVPFGNYPKELLNFRRLQLSPQEAAKITALNFQKFITYRDLTQSQILIQLQQKTFGKSK